MKIRKKIHIFLLFIGIIQVLFSSYFSIDSSFQKGSHFRAHNSEDSELTFNHNLPFHAESFLSDRVEIIIINHSSLDQKVPQFSSSSSRDIKRNQLIAQYTSELHQIRQFKTNVVYICKLQI